MPYTAVIKREGQIDFCFPLFSSFSKKIFDKLLILYAFYVFAFFLADFKFRFICKQQNFDNAHALISNHIQSY